MPKRRDLIYLDTSVILAWIKNEIRPDNEMDGVEYCMERIESGEIKAITSVNTRIEICEGDIEPDKRVVLERTLGPRRGLEQVAVDHRIAALAQEIRTFFRQGGKRLGLPDTTHLATAIHYRVDALYTFDGDDLLPLNGNVAGYNLVICKPPLPRQGRLVFPES
jgi:predicted nucleic acid-binding protein